MNLGRILADTAQRSPNTTAIVLADARATYAQLALGSALVAGLLDRVGIRAGHRVAVMLPDVPYFALAYYGILGAGATVVPLSPAVGPRAVSDALAGTRAELIIGWHEAVRATVDGAEHAGVDHLVIAPGEFETLLTQAEPLPASVQRADDDPAVIVPGPDGATLGHRRLLDEAVAARARLGLDGGAVRRLAGPLWRPEAQTEELNATVLAGATLTLTAAAEAA